MSHEGNEPADFHDFFVRSCPDLLARAQLLCGHRADAEDAVQEAYVQALRCWDRIGCYERPDLWVYKIMTQRLWAARRRWWRRQRSVELEVPQPAAASVEQTALARAVLDALGSLPARQRHAVVRFYLEDRPQDDIADEMGISRGAVAAHLSKARDNLRKKLGIGGRVEEALVAGGPPATEAPPRDQVSDALRGTHRWLRLAVETDRQLLTRIYGTVIQRVGGQEAPK